MKLAKKPEEVHATLANAWIREGRGTRFFAPKMSRLCDYSRLKILPLKI
jgi:hypothetical protein